MRQSDDLLQSNLSKAETNGIYHKIVNNGANMAIGAKKKLEDLNLMDSRKFVGYGANGGKKKSPLAGLKAEAKAIIKKQKGGGGNQQKTLLKSLEKTANDLHKKSHSLVKKGDEYLKKSLPSSLYNELTKSAHQLHKISGGGSGQVSIRPYPMPGMPRLPKRPVRKPLTGNELDAPVWALSATV